MNYKKHLFIILFFTSSYSLCMEDQKIGSQLVDDDWYYRVLEFISGEGLLQEMMPEPKVTSGEIVDEHLKRGLPVKKTKVHAIKRIKKKKNEGPKRNPTQCGICSSTDSIESVKAYEWHAHLKHSEIKFEKIWECNSCSYYFPNLASFTKHCVHSHKNIERKKLI